MLIPKKQDTDHVKVMVQLTFKELLEVNTVSGTVTVSVFMDIQWYDALISWDPAWTEGLDYMVCFFAYRKRIIRSKETLFTALFMHYCSFA